MGPQSSIEFGKMCVQNSRTSDQNITTFFLLSNVAGLCGQLAEQVEEMWIMFMNSFMCAAGRLDKEMEINPNVFFETWMLNPSRRCEQHIAKDAFVHTQYFLVRVAQGSSTEP